MSGLAIAWSLLAIGFAGSAAVLLALVSFFQNISRPNNPEAQVVNSAQALAGASVLFTLTGIAAVASTIISTVVNFISNFRYYLLFFAIAIVFAIVAPRTPAVFQVADQFSTRVLLPIWNEIGLQILNIVRTVLQPFWPVINFINSLIRTVLSIFITIFGECAFQVDVHSVVRTFFRFILSILNIVTSLLVDFESDIKIQPVFEAFANITDPFTPWFDCVCEEASFIWNPITFYLHRDNFQYSGGPFFFTLLFFPSHDLANFLLELVRRVISFAIKVLIDVFNGGAYDPFNCGAYDPVCVPYPFFNGTCNPYIQCQITREPNFQEAFDHFCNLTDHWTGSIDDIPLMIARTFFGDRTDDEVPRFVSIFSGIFCYLGRVLQGLLDFFFKLDLVLDLKIRYASRIRIDYQFEALRDTPFQIQMLFDTFRVDVLHNIGCGLANLIYSLIGLLQFVGNFVIAIASFDEDFISEFLSTYDFKTEIIDRANQMILCWQEALEFFNYEWGQAFRYTALWIIKAVQLILDSLSRLPLLFSANPEDYLTYYSANIIPGIFKMFDFAQRWGVALGNCIRTFDKLLSVVGLSEGCLQPLNDTFPITYSLELRIYGLPLPGNILTEINGIESHANLFCVGGDGVQGIVQLAVSIVQTVFHVATSIVNIIAEPDVLQGISLIRLLLDNLEMFVFYSIINIVATVNGFLSAAGSFFGCRDADGVYFKSNGEVSVGNKFKAVLGNFTKILEFPLRGVLLSGEVTGLILQCALDSSSTPIFLQDPTGCTSNEDECGNVPVVSSCSVDITSIFKTMQSVICRYVFLFWDYVFTWFPKVMVALVEFIICLADDTDNDLNFRIFYEILNSLRCIICTVVQVVLSILKAIVYLFMGDFQYFLYAIICLPPVSTIYLIVQIIVIFFKNFGCLIGALVLNDLFDETFGTAEPCPNYPTGAQTTPSFQALTFDNILNAAKFIVTRECTVDTPGADNFSPLYPQCLMVFLFKRDLQSKRSISDGSQFVTLPMDGSDVLLSAEAIWGEVAEYNYTKPESPCYQAYRYVSLLRNVTDINDPHYWARGVVSKYLAACVFSSTISNAINGQVPLMKEYPIPSDILVNPIRALNYTIGFVQYAWQAFEFISARNKDSLIAQTWQSFKEHHRLDNNFPLALVSLFDQSMHATSVALTLLSNYPETQRVMQQQMSPASSRKRSILLTSDQQNDLDYFESLSEKQIYGGVHQNESARIERGMAISNQIKRSAPGPQFSNEMFSQHVNLGKLLGRIVYGTSRMLNFFDSVDQKFKSLDQSGALKKRANLIEPHVQRRKNGLMLQAHLRVLLNVSRDMFFKSATIATQAMSNVLEMKNDPVTQNNRRSIRNLILTTRSAVETRIDPVKRVDAQDRKNEILKQLNRDKDAVQNRKRQIFNNEEVLPTLAPLHPVLLVTVDSDVLRDVMMPTQSSRYNSNLHNETLLHAKRDLSIRSVEVADRSEMIHIQHDFYTRYDEETYARGEMPIYLKKRTDTSEVYYLFEYPPGGFVFLGQLFPLADLCFPTSVIKLDIPKVLPGFPNAVVVLPGFCFKCKLILEFINRFTYLISLAIDDTVFFATTVDPIVPYDPVARTNFFFPPTVGAPVPAPTPYPSVNPFDPDIDTHDAFINLAWYIPWKLTGVTFEEADAAFEKFFTCTDIDDPECALFWMDFIVFCNPSEHARCGRGDLPGLGIEAGFLWTYGTLIVTTIILSLFGIPSTVLFFFWSISIFLWWMVAYHYSPACAVGTVLIPDCFFNDLYWVFYKISAPCLNWQPLYGDAISLQCPLDVPQCYFADTLTYVAALAPDTCPPGGVYLPPYERVFPDCSDPKYGGADPAYSLFYTIGFIWPGFTKWVQQTDSPVWSAIRSSTTVANAIDSVPNFSEGNPPADYTTCFFINSSKSTGVFFWLLFGGILAAILIFALLQLLRYLVIILTSFTVIAANTTVGLSLNGGTNATTNVVNNSAQSPPPLPQRPDVAITTTTASTRFSNRNFNSAENISINMDRSRSNSHMIRHLYHLY